MTPVDQLIQDILADFAGVELLPGELIELQEDEDREVKEMDIEPHTEQDFI